MQDVALAAAQHARQQPQPPPLQELHALARRANVQPLTGPSDKQHGIKLPPGARVARVAWGMPWSKGGQPVVAALRLCPSQLTRSLSSRPLHPAVADCLLSTNYQLKPRPRPPAAAAAAGYQQPPRQHYAVKQHEGKQKLGLAIPQQWQPAADVAGAAAEPFPPPKHQQQAAAAAVGGGAAAGLQPPTAMDVDQEEI